VELHNASEMLDAAFGDDIYNSLLQYNLSSVLPLVYGFVQTVTPALAGVHLSKAKAYFDARAAVDLVVSFVPFSNAAMCDALPDTPIITVLTDFTHSAAHPWLQHPRQIVCCGTERSHEQALDYGIPPDRAIRTSGMCVHPNFYTQPKNQTVTEREQTGANLVQSRLLKVLILFGAYPPTDVVLELVAALQSRPVLRVEGLPDEHVEALGWRAPVHVTIVCGRNAALFDALRTQPTRSDTHIIGFTDSIHERLAACDVVVGKPGPGVVSESLVSGKPVILYVGEQQSYTMEQEHDVLEFVRNAGIGKAVRTVAEAVRVSAEEIHSYTRNILALPPNRAIFEVLELVEVQARRLLTAKDTKE